MGVVWMILGGCLIGLGLAGLVVTTVLERMAVKRLQEKYHQQREG